MMEYRYYSSQKHGHHYVGVGFKIIPLQFGTFFGACFKCTRFDHFSKQSPMTLANQEQEQVKKNTNPMPLEASKEENNLTIGSIKDAKDKPKQ